MERSRYRVAVIGTGMIAESAHIPDFLSLGDHIELCALCGRNPGRLSALADAFQIPHSYIDPRQMLEKEQPDIVSICTPNQTHEAYIQMALDAGCHVICEKPISLDSHRLSALYRFAEEKGKLLVPCQNLRFRREWFQAKYCLESGLLGEVVDVRFQRIRSRGIPSWGSFHKKSVSGGGCMADIGVHMLDALLWILGNPAVESVIGFASDRLVKTTPDLFCDPATSGAGSAKVTPKAFWDSYDVEEYATGIARLSGGIPLSFQVAWAANLPEATAFQILGTRASFCFPEMQIFNGSSYIPCLVLEETRDFWADPTAGETGHRHVFRHVIQVLRGKQALEITADQAKNVCTALELFYQSAGLGRECFAREFAQNREE